MKSLDDLKKIRDEAAKNLTLRSVKGGKRIVVGMATCGITAGARPILTAFVEEVAKRKLPNIVVTQVGCIGECALEPIVEVYDEDGTRTTYGLVTLADVDRIIEEHLINGKIIEEKTLAMLKK